MAELFDYAESRADAVELIEEFAAGATVTIVSSDPRPADPDYPWEGSLYPHTGPGEAGDPDGLRITVPGVVVAYDERKNPAEVSRGSKRLLVAAKHVEDVAPAADVKRGDSVRFGDEVWQIKAVSILKPGALAILYDLEVGQ